MSSATTTQASPAKKSWAQRRQATGEALLNLPRAFGLVWQANRGGTLGMAGVTLLAALLPLGQAWTGKLIVDSVTQSLNNGRSLEAGLQAALPFLIIEFILLAASTSLQQVQMLLDRIMNARLEYALSRRIMDKAARLDLHYFEDAEFYDKLQNAQREIGFRPIATVTNSFKLAQYVIVLVSTLFLLLALSPLVTLILFISTLPTFIIQLRYSKFRFRITDWRAPEARRSQYLQTLLTSDTSIKEIKLFGLADSLLKRYDELFNKAYREDLKLGVRQTVLSTFWSVLATLSFYGAYGWIVWHTLSGVITIGSMIFYIAVFRQAQSAFQGSFSEINQLYQGTLYMKNLFSFLNLKPVVEDRAISASQPKPAYPRPGIEFRNVSFRYPNKNEWVLRGLNLYIAPGQKLALVGANGAGKTTLVKLLTRLYEPTEGQILLDGVDLRHYDLAELRQRIGVIFQDFVRYEFSVRENIGFGQVEELGNSTQIELAARKAGADSLIEKLPQGYDTTLGTRFHQGRQLSGGEWQKIALARAFMRDSDLLVLDEPTAALDADSEFEVFERLRELTKDRMTLFISHRFSSVRMADQIAVLEGGRLVELGTHLELLSLGGNYARWFDLQAAGYR
jgi:ATP-binding cassette subfamily B protein